MMRRAQGLERFPATKQVLSLYQLGHKYLLTALLGILTATGTSKQREFSILMQLLCLQCLGCYFPTKPQTEITPPALPDARHPLDQLGSVEPKLQRSS